MEDFSENTLPEKATELASGELDEQLKDRISARTFRECAFWGVSAVTTLYLLCFLGWVCALLYRFIDHPDFLDHGNHLWTICLILLAVIPTTLALSLLRFTFRDKNDSRPEQDVPGLWLQMAKEIADVVKHYISKKA